MDKQDRLVVLVGAIILVIAVIGIVYHEETYVESKEDEEQTSFKVSWKTFSEDLSDTLSVAEGETAVQTYNLAVNNPTACIYRVELELTWEDDWNFRGLILPWNWSDEVSASVSIDELGQFSQSASGYAALEMSASVEQPEDFKVETQDTETLSALIKERGYARSEVNVDVNLDIDAKPIILDSGNEITVHLTYHYCTPEIIEA
jgi:hypothetical protein